MPQSPALSGKVVLVVDDDDDIREVAVASLELIGGFTVTTATSGIEALNIARESPPDAVLLDVMMPGVDGYETARRLKADPATAAVPVILLTARVGGDPAADVAVGVIAKPFDPMNLAGQVRSILGWPS
ncbi:response regulator [Micropruina sonneratiae]|uniref:response regulator n=1 Tax=Micropruina sonneratiae TaxID=2986940 RepID=UPI0022275DA1|nr:response regulator [Micropruina sp. KQZ13P-5]MCW3156695.1 response regulator [Micropruina sp. KQZ13P-5]